MATKPKLTEKQEATNELVRSRFRVAKSARAPLDERFLRWYKLWRSWGDQNTWADGSPRSSLFIPKTQEAVLNIFARAVGARPKAVFEPSNDPADLPKKDLWRRLYEYDWWKTGMEETGGLWFLQSLIYGTALIQMPWRKEEKTWTEEEPLVELGSLKLGKKIKKHSDVVFDGPDPELVDVFNFYPPPNAPYDLQKHVYDIVRQVVTLEEFQRTIGRNTAYDQKAVAMVEGNRRPPDWPSPVAALESESSLEPSGTKWVELLHMIQNDRLITVVNGEKDVPPLRNQNNPYRHGKKWLVESRFIPDPMRFWGIGLVEILEDLQLELNATRNQRIDNVTLTMNKVMAMREDLLVDPSEAYSAPGNVIRIKKEAVSPKEAIFTLDLGAVQAEAFAEEDRILNDMEGVSGVTSYIKGQDNSSLNDTATGITVVTEQGNVRINMHLSFFERALAKHAEMDMQLDQQFLTKGKTIKIVGESGETDYLTLKKSDIAGSFDVYVQAGSTRPVNQQIQMQEALSMYNLLKGDPDVDQRKLKKLVLEAFGRKDAEDLLVQKSSVEDEAVAAEDENQQLAQGLRVPVDPSHNHDVHQAVHGDFKSVEELSPEAMAVLDEHMAAHESAKAQQGVMGEIATPAASTIPTNETGLVRRSGRTRL